MSHPIQGDLTVVLCPLFTLGPLTNEMALEIFAELYVVLKM